MSISDLTVSNLNKAFNKVKTQIKEYFIEPKEDTITNLKLDIIGSETLAMSNDITDYFVENNTAYQDQVSIKPLIYTIRGEVGEVVWYKKDETNSVMGAVAQKLAPVASFLPSVSKSMTSIQDKAMKVISLADSVDNFASRLLTNGEETKQRAIYKYLRDLRENRTPINIKTAWGNLGNVSDKKNPNDYVGFMIQDVNLEQSGTVDKTIISITLKEFRVTTTKVTSFNAKSFSSRLAEQKETGDSDSIATRFKVGYATGFGAIAPDTTVYNEIKTVENGTFNWGIR